MAKLGGKGVDESRPVVAPAFGKRLKQARIDAKLTQGQVQRFVGIDATSLSYLENGKTRSPDPVQLKMMADRYGVSFVELVDLLEWSRTHPKVETAPQEIPKAEEGMRISGLEEVLILRLRDENISPQGVLAYLDFQKGGALEGGATFRQPRKRPTGR